MRSPVCECSLPADRVEGRLATRNLGRGPAGEHIFESKRPVEVDDEGTDARNRTKETWPCKSQVSRAVLTAETITHLSPYSIIISQCRGVNPFFVLKPIETQRGRSVVLQLNAGGGPSHPCHPSSGPLRLPHCPTHTDPGGGKNEEMTDGTSATASMRHIFRVWNASDSQN
jgi:hypothetical protein